jgi:hypothetical protein
MGVNVPSCTRIDGPLKGHGVGTLLGSYSCFYFFHRPVDDCFLLVPGYMPYLVSTGQKSPMFSSSEWRFYEYVCISFFSVGK